MSPQAVVRIAAPLPAEAPVEVEELLAEALGDGRYRLVEPPFIAYGLAVGDVVRCDGEDPPRLTEVEQPSGAATVRFLVAEGAPPLDLMKLQLGLKQLGVVAGEPKGRYHALTVPADRDGEAVLDALEAAAEAGLVEYEVASEGG